MMMIVTVLRPSVVVLHHTGPVDPRYALIELLVKDALDSTYRQDPC